MGYYESLRRVQIARVPGLASCTRRICDAKGSACGTGFPVGESLTVTCAHMVEMCGAGPSDSVHFASLFWIGDPAENVRADGNELAAACGDANVRL